MASLTPVPLPADTIVAISTPPGRGGIGIVRLSGPRAVALATALTTLGRPLTAQDDHARARFTRILDDDGHPLDEALVTAFFAPHSYTGEDLVEIAAHGSPVVLDTIVHRTLALGRAALTPHASSTEHLVRLAEPGEFSRRAFFAGRLDLTQAEAIHDLIAAQTLAQARTAAQQLGGALARRIAPAKQQLVHLIAMLEAGMDFATGELDDVDTMPPARIAAALGDITAALSALERTFRAAHIARTGARLALIGRPNAGKSSLFNRLLDRDRAIVTAAPGTTRDTLEESFALDGIPLRLVDTAGLRAASSDTALSEAEQLGILRSREALAEADLILLIEDATAATPSADPALATLLTGRPTLHIRNKIDLLGAAADPRRSTPHSSELDPFTTDSIATSALTGEGLDVLRAAILAHLRSHAADPAEAALTNHRQHAAIEETLRHLDAATASNCAHHPHEVLLLDLHEALRALDTLTGTTTPDDILALIFSTFCIGK